MTQTAEAARPAIRPRIAAKSGLFLFLGANVAAVTVLFAQAGVSQNVLITIGRLAGLYGALAREYGAHVALASGDDVFAEETRPLFPDARFETVKTARGASSGDTLTPAASCARIATAARETVAHALSSGWRATAHRPAAAACTLRVQTAALADLFCILPTLERVDAVTLRFDGPSVEHVVRTLNSLSAMSFMLR